MNKTQRIRGAVSVFLSFLLCISLVLISAAAVLRGTLFNESFIKKTLQKSGYGKQVQSELYTQFLSYGNACNIGDSFFEKFFKDTLTEEFIDNNTAKYFEDIYTSSKAKVDTSALEKALKPALYEYAVEMGYENEPTLDEDLDVIVGELAEIYAKFMALPKVSTINSVLTRYGKAVDIALVCLLAFAIVVSVIIFVSYKKKAEPIRYYIYALSGAFLMTLAFPLYVRFSGLVEKVNITSKSLYSLIVNYANDILYGFFICSAVLAVGVAVYAVIYAKTVKRN